MKKLINFLTNILAFFTPKRFKRFVNYETVSYLFFGGLTTLVSLSLFALFYYVIGMEASAATAVSNVLAIVFAFFPNKLYVFESKSWEAGVLVPEVVKFGASRALTFVLEFLAMWLLVDSLGFHAMLMRLLVALVIQVIGNYVLSKWIVFTKKGDNNVL